MISMGWYISCILSGCLKCKVCYDLSVSLFFVKKQKKSHRREKRDSNPWYNSIVRWFSKPMPSTAQPFPQKKNTVVTEKTTLILTLHPDIPVQIEDLFNIPNIPAGCQGYKSSICQSGMSGCYTFLKKM